MRSLADAKCTKCGLTPQYHSIKHKAFEKTQDKLKETDKPPHAFALGMR